LTVADPKVSGKLGEFGAYRLSLELFDLVVEDVGRWLNRRRFERLISQQIASADSVCSNIEEGYGRDSTAEYRRFLIIARGSLRETGGRYKRFTHWIPADTVQERTTLIEEINRILTSTIDTLVGRRK